MKKSKSPLRKRNPALLNLLGTPGLGSLLAKRWLAGIGQLLLALTGFAMICVWCDREVNREWQQGMDFEGAPTHAIPYTLLKWGLAVFALAWLWSLVTSVSLLRAAARAKLDSLNNFSAGLLKLDETKIQSALAAVPQWQRNGDVIACTFVFKDFPAAIKFVQAVAVLAEQAWHHPDIDIRWNKVTLTLTTHDAGSLTEKDFALARQFDQL